MSFAAGMKKGAGERLSNALVTLGKPECTRLECETAARTVLDLVRPWAMPHFRRTFRNQLRQFAADEREEILQHAVDDIVLTARRGAFRHGGERAAHAWCKRVVHNRLMADLKRRSSRPPELPVPSTTEARTENTEPISNLGELIRLLERTVAGSCRACDRPSLIQNLHCYIANRLGQEMSSSAHESAHTPSSTAERRARDVLYQRRRRGKKLAARALRLVTTSDEWDDSLARAAFLLGLLPNPQRAE